MKVLNGRLQIVGHTAWVLYLIVFSLRQGLPTTFIIVTEENDFGDSYIFSKYQPAGESICNQLSSHEVEESNWQALLSAIVILDKGPNQNAFIHTCLIGARRHVVVSSSWTGPNKSEEQLTGRISKFYTSPPSLAEVIYLKDCI